VCERAPARAREREREKSLDGTADSFDATALDATAGSSLDGSAWMAQLFAC
jgi:hypothetical protein